MDQLPLNLPTPRELNRIVGMQQVLNGLIPTTLKEIEPETTMLIQNSSLYQMLTNSNLGVRYTIITMEHLIILLTMTIWQNSSLAL